MGPRHIRQTQVALPLAIAGVLGLTGCGRGEEPEPVSAPAESTSVPPSAEGQPAETPLAADIEDSSTRPTSTYSYDLPKTYPLAAASWKTNLPQDFQAFPWAADFDGVGTPMRTISVDGASVLYGFLCEPHNCAGNHIGFLLTRDQRRVVGFVQVTDDQTGAASITPVGSPTVAEQACLMKLDQDIEATTC